MLRTWPGVRPKAMPLLSSGTMLASPSRVTPWSAWAPVEAVAGAGDRVGVVGPAPVVQHGPDVGRVVGLDGQDARGGVEVGLVADQRGGALEGGDADVLEDERAEQEVVLVGVDVEGLAGLDQARRGGRVGEALAGC